MPYIPSEWINNEKNEKKVHELLEKLDQDTIEEGSNIEKEVVTELEKLGETKIIEKLKDGVFSFGG